MFDLLTSFVATIAALYVWDNHLKGKTLKDVIK